ncbi:hypothetical protein LTS18_006586, partial [Coniosporium uncinatum]
MSPLDWTNICGFVGLGLAACAAAPAVGSVGQACLYRRRQTFDEKELYEDKDGVATLESQKKYSVRIQIGTLVITSIAGFFSALAAYIFLKVPYLHDDLVKAHGIRAIEAWTWLAIWLFSTIQLANIILQKQPFKRHNSALLAGISYSLLLILLIIGLFQAIFAPSQPYGVDTPWGYCIIAQTVVAVFGLIACIS